MRSDSRKRILVTGGAGFLGSHLCEKLLNMGNEVLCVDNLYTGTKDNILSLMDNPHFEFMRHDVTFPLYVEADEIYNLACPASPVHYQFDPVQTTKTSVHGAINMLGLAKRLKAKILQASTSEVYGDPEQHPQSESYWGHVNTIGPRACYDEGKRCAETLFLITIDSFKCRSKLSGFLIPMGRECIPTMVGWYRTLSCRHYGANRLRSTGMDLKLGHSALFQIWLKLLFGPWAQKMISPAR